MPSDGNGNGNGTSAKHSLTFNEEVVADLTDMLEELTESEIYELLLEIQDQRKRWIVLSQISSCNTHTGACKCKKAKA
jgi:hypothetical protein